MERALLSVTSFNSKEYSTLKFIDSSCKASLGIHLTYWWIGISSIMSIVELFQLDAWAVGVSSGKLFHRFND